MNKETPTYNLLARLDEHGSKSGEITGFIINCHGKDKDDYISGASNDIKKLKKAWKEVSIKFQEQSEANCADDFKKVIETLKTKDFSSKSGICLVVLSHGALGDIITFGRSGNFFWQFLCVHLYLEATFVTLSQQNDKENYVLVK